ncbi:MAG: ABC transporter ATP-binding protein [Candidatus Bathyarchaeia archaeon]|nr:ABC transporter ATP-binding protein [Candidatus Bathyarchaeota archaeon]
MLEGTGLIKRFGALEAIKDVSFKVNEKEVVGLIGPNGSGKTTLFNLISGVYKPDSGKIKFMGEDITGLPSHKICRMGIARTYQLVRPFLNMSVLENVMVGALYGAGNGLSKSRSESLEYLRFVGLDHKKDVPARNLNICERKFLEIARALATKPKILLLDEPLSGLNPKEINDAKDLIKRIRDDFGVTVFWVEHIMKALRGIVERVIVLNYGEKIAEGSFEEVTSNQRVIEAYLGEKWVI